MNEYQDPSQLYGNSTVEQMQQQHAAAAMSYGGGEAAYTHARASYGPGPQTVLAGMRQGGHTLGAGATAGMGQMFSDIGGMVRPVSHTPPAQVFPGYSGMYAQEGGLGSSFKRSVGLGYAPFGATEATYQRFAAEDFGDRLGGGAAAVASYGTGLALGGTALSAGMGVVGSSVGSAAGSMLGGSVGGKLLGGLGGVAGSALGGYAVGMAGAQAVMESVSQHRDIQNYVHSAGFRWFTSSGDNTDPRTGQGLSRGGRRQVAEFTRELDVEDPMLNTDQLKDILQGAGERGLFAGETEIEDFKRKFREVKENVKTVAKTLHTTLEEGLDTLKELKGIGVEGTDVYSLTQGAASMGKVAGRTGREMLSLGMQGAELFRGTGIDMEIGAQAAMMNVSAVRAARDAGELSQEAIAQAGGEEALAQRMTAGGLGFTQSAYGRGYGAAFFSPGAGESGLNRQAFMKTMMSGGGDFFEQAQKSAAALSSPGKLLSYQGRQEEFMSDIGEMYGGRGAQMMETAAITSQAQMMANITDDTTFEDAFFAVGKSRQFNKSHQELQAMLGEARSAEEIYESRQRAAGAQRDEMVMEQSIQNNKMYRLYDKMGDMGKRAVDVVGQPLNAGGQWLSKQSQEITEEHWYGVQRGDVSGIDTETFSGGRRKKGPDIGPIDLNEGAMGSPGESLLEAVNTGAFGERAKDLIKTSKDKEGMKYILGEGYSVGGRGGSAGQVGISRSRGAGLDNVYFGVDEQGAKDLFSMARKLDVGQSEAQEMLESGRLDAIRKEGPDITRALYEGKLFDESGELQKDPVKLAEQVFGKSFENISREEMAYLRTQTKDFGGINEALSDARRGALAVESAKDRAEVEQMQEVQRQFEGVSDRVAATIGVDELAFGVLEGAANAYDLNAKAQKKETEAKAAERQGNTEVAKEKRRKARQLRKQAESAEAGAIEKQIKAMPEGANAERISKEIRSLSSGSGAEDMALMGEAADILSQAQGLQFARGSRDLVSIVENDLTRVNLTGDERRQALKASRRASSGMVSLMGLAEAEEGGVLADEKEAFSSTQTGAAMLKAGEALSELSGFDAGTKTKKVRQTFERMGISEEEVTRSVKAWNRGEQQTAMQQAYQASISSLTTDKELSGSQSVGDEGEEMGTAQEEYALQTSINKATLSVMQEIARRLGAQ